MREREPRNYKKSQVTNYVNITDYAQTGTKQITPIKS